MKKQFGKISTIFILTFLILLSSVLCFVAVAENSGSDNSVVWKYKIEGNTATITGVDIATHVKNLVIPSEIIENQVSYPVVAIADSAFAGKKFVINGITIPDTVTKLGNSVFANSYIFGDVVIPESVTSIGTALFENCIALKSVTLPSAITSLPEKTFKGCTALTTVNIDGIEKFGNEAFYKCSALYNVSLSSKAREIGDNVFYECQALTGDWDLSLITSLGQNAFYNCSRIEGFTIPNAEHSFSSYTSCKNVSKYKTHNDNPRYSSLDGVIHSKDLSTIVLYPPNKEDATYYIDSRVTVIGIGAFANNVKNLEKAVLHENIKEIRQEAFSGSSITSAYIPDGIETVSVDVFKNCASLEWVVFGSNVVAVGCDSFRGTSSLKYVIAKNDNLLQPDNVTTFYYASEYNCSNHVYGYQDKAPTCSDYGFNCCIICDRATYVKALGHSGAIIESHDLTCTNDAYDVIDCLRCNETVTVTREKAHGHVPSGFAKVVPQTYNKPGYTINTCKVCKASFISDYNANFTLVGDINFDGIINFSDLIVLQQYVNDPSSVKEINRTIFIDLTGDSKITQADVDKLEKYLLGEDVKFPSRFFRCDNHNRYKETVVISEASCTSSALSFSYCKNCGYHIDTTESGFLEHDLSTIKYIASGCLTNGHLIEKCSICENTFNTLLDVVPHTHKWYTIASQKGYEYSTCSVCGTFESRNVDYTAFDALISQIPLKYYETYYTAETVSKLKPILDSNKLTLTQEEVDKNVKLLQEILPNVQYNIGNIPVVFVDTHDGGLSKEYRDSRIIVVYRDDDGSTKVEAIEYNGTAKVRGNSTANANKYPLNLKFSSKVNLFGMGAGKKYCLLANLYDQTLFRNALAIEFANSIGLSHAPKYEFVEVYINGSYRGFYMLTTPVDVGEDRTDIDEDNDYLLEIESTGMAAEAGGYYMFSPIYRVRVLVESPEDMSAEAFSKFISTYYSIDFAIFSGDWETIQQYVDVDSMAKYYVLHEYLKDLDIIWDSTRFTIVDVETVVNGETIVTPKLSSGPIWDFDISMGNMGSKSGGTDSSWYHYHNGDPNKSGGIKDDSTTGFWANAQWKGWANSSWNTNSIWFNGLFQHSPDFLALVSDYVDKYEDEMSIMYESVYDEDGDVVTLSRIDEIITNQDLFDAIRRNYTVHGIATSYSSMTMLKYSYTDAVAFIRDWLEDRHDWISLNYNFTVEEELPEEEIPEDVVE